MDLKGFINDLRLHGDYVVSANFYECSGAFELADLANALQELADRQQQLSDKLDLIIGSKPTKTPEGE